MQNPNENTEWNDALRKHGIIPAKKEITEDQIVSLVDEAAQRRLEPQARDLGELNLDELDLLEDEEDERVLQAYRQQRIIEMQLQAQKQKFGEIVNITAVDWVEQVNEASKEVAVVVLLYKNGILLCDILDEHFRKLAAKFRDTKFVRGAAQTCMPNFPDDHLPCVMIYRDGKPERKFLGSEIWGNRPTLDTCEWILAKKAKVFKTTLEKDPRPKTVDVLLRQLNVAEDVSDDDD